MFSIPTVQWSMSQGVGATQGPRHRPGQQPLPHPAGRGTPPKFCINTNFEGPRIITKSCTTLTHTPPLLDSTGGADCHDAAQGQGGQRPGGRPAGVPGGDHRVQPPRARHHCRRTGGTRPLASTPLLTRNSGRPGWKCLTDFLYVARRCVDDPLRWTS